MKLRTKRAQAVAEIMDKFIIYYRSAKGCKPDRITIYRDQATIIDLKKGDKHRGIPVDAI